jgi:hypothetical protein
LYFNLQKQAEDLKKIVEDRKRQGQRLLREAKEATGAAPGEPEFDTLQENFSTLPDTTDGIDIAIKDNEGRLEFCGPDVNANVSTNRRASKIEWDTSFFLVEAVVNKLSKTCNLIVA